jgi:hypothetical protein
MFIGFVLAALGNKIWKEDVRYKATINWEGPVALASREKLGKKFILFGLFLLFFGPLLCYIIYFDVPPRGSFAGSFLFFIAGLTMFPIGMALIFFGITSLERNALLKYNIPEHHFLWVEGHKIRRKSIEIGFCMIFLYLTLFLLFIVPRIIEYNEFWADGHSGARSPFGSGGECCSIILIVIFIVVFVILKTVLIFKLKQDYIKGFEEFNKIR